MPQFANPFTGDVPRNMSHDELVRAIMLNISAEFEAAFIYQAHMDATDDEDAKKVLKDIIQEELLHAGEFTSLLYRLEPEAGKQAENGFAEVQQMLGKPAPTELQSSEQKQAA